MVDLWIPRRVDREEVLMVCQEAFVGRYRVYRWDFLGEVVVVRKSAWTGVVVKTKQEGGRTRIRMTGFAPSPWVHVIKTFALYLAYGWYTWRRLRREVHGVLADRLIRPAASPPSAAASTALQH